MSETVRNKPEHRHVEYRDINLIPCLVVLQLPEKDNLQVATALFLHNGDGDQAICWHVYVKPEHRRKGYATGLLEHAKTRWNEIASDWESEAGHAVALKCGFKSRKGDSLRLVWKKGGDTLVAGTGDTPVAPTGKEQEYGVHGIQEGGSVSEGESR
jgi:GNAT superfamily N-acetyltransferase